MPHRVLLFAHPQRAVKGRFNLKNVQAALLSLGHHVEVVYSQPNRRRSISELQQYREQVDEVVVLGGDGTVNTAANAFVHTDVIVTILPTGTGNDFVRSLGNRRVALNDRLMAPTRRIDLGEVNGDVFVNAAGLGFDVAVLEHMAQLRARPGVLVYKLLALAGVARFVPQTITVHSGQRRLCLPTLILVIANGRFFGGGIPIALDNQIDNSSLRLAWSSHVGRWQRWPFLLRVLAGKLPRKSDEPPIIQQDIQSLKIVTPGLRMQLDGELIQQTPAFIRTLPQALRVRVLY